MCLRTIGPDAAEAKWASTGDSAAVTLSRVAQSHILCPDVVERLANIAAARTDMEHREEIVRGLARQWYGAAQDVANRIRERLNTCRGYATRRALEVAVAACRLKTVPVAEQRQLIHRLIIMWSQEADPAQRAALATIVGFARLESLRSSIVSIARRQTHAIGPMPARSYESFSTLRRVFSQYPARSGQ